MVTKLFAIILILSFVVVPFAEAQVSAGAVSDGGRFVLTGSGAAKVSSAMAKISRGLSIARGLGFLGGQIGIGLVLLDIALNTWDWAVNLYNDDVSFLQAPEQYQPGACWTVPGQFQVQYVSGRCAAAGQNALSAKWTSGTDCGIDGGYVVTTMTPGYNVIGTSISKLVGGNCTYWHLNSYFEATTSLEAGSAAIPGAVPAPTDSNAAVIGQLEAARAAVASSARVDGAGVALPDGVTRGHAVEDQIAALDAAITALRYGVPLVSGTDYSPGATIADPQPTAPLLGPSTTADAGQAVSVDMAATNSKLDSINASLQAAPSLATAFACPTCDRTTQWSVMMQSWQSQAASAPVFALVGNLAWPGSGSVQRVWSLGSWQGGALSVDLETSGIATVITVVRFVVIGGAVLLAYMIIFG